jgi:hypothetical protein
MNVVTAAMPRTRPNMTRFTVNIENQITAVPPTEGSAEPTAGESFGSQTEFTALAANWPGNRLVAIWNGLPGVSPVKKFTDHKTAVRRIWDKVRPLDTDVAAETPAVAPKRREARKRRGNKDRSNTGWENSKASQVIGLLRRAKGATLAELMETTGWQAHSIRGFISAGLGKRLGFTVQSSRREDGARVYKISS